MKRSNILFSIETLLDLMEEYSGTKTNKDKAEMLLYKLEELGMRPPEWTEHNNGKGAGGAWAARRLGDWEPEDGE